jgi:hypothetical protein
VKKVIETIQSNSQINDPLEPLVVSWSPVPQAKGYNVEFSSSARFTSPVRQYVEDISAELNLPRIGTFYVRTWAIGEDNRVISPMSRPVKMVYKRVKIKRVPKKIPRPLVMKTPKKTILKKVVNSKATSRDKVIKVAKKPESLGLRAPATVSPAYDSTMVFLSKSASHVVLSWKKVPGAESYEVEVSSDKSFRKPYHRNKTFAQKELVQKALPSGRNYWRIRAISKKSQSSWSQAIPFVVSYEN